MADEPDRRDEGGPQRVRAWTWVVANAGMWLLVGVGATLLFANGRATRPRLADAVDRAAEKMKLLDLTPAQQSALDAIRSEWRDAVLKEETGYNDRIFAAAHGADDRIEALLTDAQRSRYRELSLQPPPSK